MSQEASTPSPLAHLKRNALTPAWTALETGGGATGRFSANAYADRLMDELFEDVERSLDLNGNLPESQVVVEESIPELVAPPAASLVVQPVSEEEEPEEPEEVELFEPEAVLPMEVRQPGRAYDRLLLGLACVAAIAALVVWLLWREVKQPAIVAAPQATASPLNPADAQFAEYAKQALQSLTDRPQPDRKSLPSPTVSPLPGVTLPRPTARTTGGLGSAYVPPYQMPPTPVAPSAVASPLPRPSIVNPPARSPEPSPSPTVARTLVGVLELGDRSAALVEIAGVVQRFRIGESISASGWTLVEVSKNQAVIRRNGEVRSIFIGQAF